MSSTPTTTEAEARNYVQTPRPFKSASQAKTGNKRTKSLKQILAAERDAAFGGGAAADAKKASKSKKALTGAAAAAARRRGEHLLATATTSAANSGAATPSVAEGEADQDGDATMASVAGTESALLDVEGAVEQARKRRRDVPTYSSIEAPPSLRPQKKFCDVTGLIAPYTDPKTGLRYHSVEIYEIVKNFASGVDQAYLTLRGSQTQIK